MHEHAARAACHIVNILAADSPKHEQYGEILRVILWAMQEARAEREALFLPSEN